MTERESWARYVHRVASGRSQKEIADAAGIDQSGVSRWLGPKAERPHADTAVRFARNMGQRPVEALIAARYLELEDAEGGFAVMFTPAGLTDEDMLEELRVRLAQRPLGGDIGLPTANGAGS